MFFNGCHTGGTGHAGDAEETLLKISVVPLKASVLLPCAGDAAFMGGLLLPWNEGKDIVKNGKKFNREATLKGKKFNRKATLKR